MSHAAVRRTLLSIGLVVALGLVSTSCDQDRDSDSPTTEGAAPSFAELEGPYLGQDPPGLTPVMFAPGLLSVGGLETSITFAPDGMSFAYTLYTGGDQLLPEPRGPFRKMVIMHARVESGRWTEPTELPFTPGRIARYPSFSPDGARLFYNFRPAGIDPPDSMAPDIWYVERSGSGWTDPQLISFEGDYPDDRKVGVYPTTAANGNMYFAIFPDRQNGILCVSRYEDGKYLAPEQLYEELQTYGNHPYIAPDESYLLFDWEHPEEQYGENDLLISFRGEDGKWMKAQSLGAGVNTEYHDWRPFVSFDGKYLFFSSNRIDSPELGDEPVTLQQVRDLVDVPADSFQHLYWVDAGVIDELRPEDED